MSRCRNLFTINIKRIKPFNASTPTTLNSSPNEGHYEVEEVLKEHTIDTGRREYKAKWVGYNSWVVEEDLHANRLLEQFQASRSSAATDGVQNPRNTADDVHAGRGR